MTTINKLSPVDAVVSSDQVPIWQNVNGDARRASINVITEYVTNQITTDLTPLISAAVATYLSNLPTTLPATAGVIWDNGGYISTTQGSAIPTALPNAHSSTTTADTNNSSLVTTLYGPDGKNWIPFGGFKGINYSHLDVIQSHIGASFSASSSFITTIGSGAFGPTNSDYAHVFGAQKANNLSTIIDGEIGGGYAIVLQGRYGDAAGYLADVSKVHTGTGPNWTGAAPGDNSGGMVGLETGFKWKDTSGTVTRNYHVVVGYGEGSDGLSSGGGYGIHVEAWRAQAFAGVWVDSYNIFSDAPGTYGNIFAFGATVDRDITKVYYLIRGDIVTGVEQPGDIIQGKAPNSSTIRTKSDGTFVLRDAADSLDRFSIDQAGTAHISPNIATPAAGSTTARLLFGTTVGFGIYYGSGAPTVSAAKGSLYLRSDGSGVNDRSYINTNGATTWTAVVTVA